MNDKGYAVFGLTLLAIAVVYTIYTVFVIYDIKIETQTIIYYFMAVCFLTSVVYGFYKDSKKKVTRLIRTQTVIKSDSTVIDRSKQQYPYSDFFN